MDEAVGDIIAAYKQKGLWDSTFVGKPGSRGLVLRVRHEGQEQVWGAQVWGAGAQNEGCMPSVLPCH